MAFNPFDSERKPPENAPLRRAIAKLVSDPTPENRAAVHAALVAGPLLIALRELPKEMGCDPQALAGDIPIQFVTSKAPGGRPVLAAFTDAQAVAKRAPAGVWLGVAPLALLNWIVEEGLEGLMLNPDGVSARSPRMRSARRSPACRTGPARPAASSPASPGPGSTSASRRTSTAR
jgi:hypothetical protein